MCNDDMCGSVPFETNVILKKHYTPSLNGKTPQNDALILLLLLLLIPLSKKNISFEC